MYTYKSKGLSKYFGGFSDEKMTKSDWTSFKHNQDSFLCLSSVEDIARRCAQRDVFSNNASKYVIDCLKSHGKRQAIGNCFIYYFLLTMSIQLLAY